MMIPRLILLLVIIEIIVLSSGLYPATLRVPGEFSTIQAAIDAGSDGDTVLVASGTYSGDGNRDINFNGRSIILKSELGPVVTTIECGGSVLEPHRGFYFISGETFETVVEGFTITNGYAPIDILNDYSTGGAICCYESSPRVIDCEFSNCEAGDFGGVIFCWESSPEIEGCVFNDNSAQYGGAVYLIWFSSPTVTGCSFINNIAVYHGGALDCTYHSAPTFSNSLFSYNEAVSGGAVLCYYYSDAIFNSCTYRYNTATWGGGLCAFAASAPDMNYCTFYKNSADWGGTVRSYVSFPNMTNCTLFGNQADSAGAGLFINEYNSQLTNCIIAFSSAGEAVSGKGVSLICCDIFSNEGGDWVGDIAVQFGQNGNFSLNPVFCDTSFADLNLQLISPCSPDHSECQVLIGANDVGCETFICGDADDSDFVDISDVTFLVAYIFNSGPAPFPLLKCDVDCNLIVEVSDLAYLIAYIFNGGPEPCANC